MDGQFVNWKPSSLRIALPRKRHWAGVSLAVLVALVACFGLLLAVPSGARAAAPVTFANYSMGAYREASYGTPPNGLGTPDDYTGSMAGCHLKIVLTFPGAVSVSDQTALGNSLKYTVSGAVFASTATPSTGQTTGPDRALTTYTPSGSTLTIDTYILYLPGGVITIDADTTTTTGGVMNGITAAGAPVQWTEINTVVPTGLATKTISVTVGTATTAASTTIQVTHSANVRSMNHVVWLSNGASIITGTSTSQTTPAHHHAYYSFTTTDSANAISSYATNATLTAGYTVTQSGDTVTITAKTAKAGEVLDIKVYDDDFLRANARTINNQLSGLSYPAISVADQAYTGSPLTPDLHVAGTAYNKTTSPAASYTNNTNVGTGSASVTAAGVPLSGYTYSCTFGSPFAIAAANLSTATIAAIPDQIYTGSSITPVLTVTYNGKTLVHGTDYTVAYSNNTSVGTATATITGMGNFNGTKSATFNIVSPGGESLAKATIAAIANQTYTGSALTPSVKVTLNGKTLKKGTDYTVAYSNNVNVGTARVKITGIGTFTGSTKTTFRITPSKVTILKAATGSVKGTVVVSWVQGKGGVTGYEVAHSKRFNGTYVRAGLTFQLSMTFRIPFGASKVNTPPGRLVMGTVSGLKSGATYYFKVRAYVVIGGTKYYGAWSNVLSAKAR